MTQESTWKVRKAKLEDTSRIVELARDYNEFLMPYILNEFVVRNYIDQFMVAEMAQVGVEEHYNLPDLLDVIGGALHVITESSGLAGLRFLFYVKQVPNEIISSFQSAKGVAFIGQIICPGTGSFYAILEELKKEYKEIWCWMSIIGPSYSLYKRYGFKFYEEKRFWNVYKCDYSTFSLGEWIK